MIDKSSFEEIKIPCLETKSYYIRSVEFDILLKNNNLKYYKKKLNSFGLVFADLSENSMNISESYYEILFDCTEVYEDLSNGSVIIFLSYYAILLDNIEQFKTVFLRNSFDIIHINGQSTIYMFIKDRIFLNSLLSEYSYKKVYYSEEGYYILTFEDGRMLRTKEYLNKIISAVLYNNLEDYNNYLLEMQHLEDLANDMG